MAGSGRRQADGEAGIITSRGTLRASLDRSRRFRSGILRISAEGDNGDSGVTGGSGGSLSGSDESELRDEISFYLSRAVVGLVGA